MIFHMGRIIREKLQVFNSIVLFILDRINRIFRAFVMHNFFSFKIVTKMLFHYKTRAKNVTFFCKRVLRFMDKYVLITIFSFSIFPIRMVFSRKISVMFSHFLFTPLCMCKTNMRFTNLFSDFNRHNFSLIAFANFIPMVFRQFLVFIPRCIVFFKSVFISFLKSHTLSIAY